MRKKHKAYQTPVVRIEPLPKAFLASEANNNLQEQKRRFLKHGKTPTFVVEGDTAAVEELASKCSGKIRFDLLGEAEYIINTVKQKYGMGENYLDHIYGPRIEQKEANNILFQYIGENSLQESMAVYWSNEMTCSARMVWKGYSFKCNRPEMRRYALWLNGSHENPYLRRDGLQCLLDHEIGTHFFRCYNDGFQPWFYDRKKFGLRGTGSFESLCTEEGLAAINTTLRAKENYLWLSALTYYTACKSTEMNFKQLFDHLGLFIHNPEQRWKHVMRVKRGLVDPNDLGGYGKDQCYFEGAVSILRNIDDINFNLLMCGKVCYDEVSRIKRMARMGSVCLPAIMQDMDQYRRQLKKMATLNGLHLEHPSYQPPRAYLQRLKERQAGIQRKRKVRKGKKGVNSSPSGSKVSGSNTDESSPVTSEESECVIDMTAPPANLGGPRRRDYPFNEYEAFMAGEGTSRDSYFFSPDIPSGSGSSPPGYQSGCGKRSMVAEVGKWQYAGASKAKTTQIPVACSSSSAGKKSSSQQQQQQQPLVKRKERPHTVATERSNSPSGSSRLPTRVHQGLQPLSGDIAGPSCCLDDDDNDDDDDDFQSLSSDLWLHNLNTPPSSSCSSPSPSTSPCLGFTVDVPFQLSHTVLPPIGKKSGKASPDKAQNSSTGMFGSSLSHNTSSSSSDKTRGSSFDKPRDSTANKSRISSAEKSRNSSADKSRNSSPDKSRLSSAKKSMIPSADKSRNSSADKSSNSSPVKSSNSSPVKSSNSSPVKSRISSPVKSSNSSPVKSRISSPVKSRISSANKSQISSTTKSRILSADKFKSSSSSGTSSATQPKAKAEHKSKSLHGSYKPRPLS